MTAVNFTYSADNSQYVASLGEMITATANFGAASKTLAGNIANIGVATTRMAANVAMGRQAFSNAQQMAAAYEQKLSSIEARTVVAGKSFQTLGTQVRQMARDIPGGINVAVQQVETLQRMGVTAEKSLVPLATTMAKIGAANSELGPQLTQSFSQLQRTFNTLNPTAAAKFGDSLTSVASKAGASATGISDFSNAIAPLAQTLGMTQTQVMGFAAGFAKSGQEGYLAANVFNRMLSDMERSAREGTGELQVYADTVGMTSKAFTSLVKNNPAEAVLSVFDALSKGGSDSLRTLERLGLDGPRTLKTITAVAQSGDLRKTVEEALGGYGSGSTEKGAQAAFGGLNDEMGRTVETMQQLTEAAGRPLLNVMTGIVREANAVGGAFTNIVNSGIVQSMTGALMVGGGLAGLAGKIGTGVLMAGGLKSGIGMLPAAGRAGVGNAMTWMGANRGRMLMGAGGVTAAGMMMDNSSLATLGTLGFMASSFAPQGTAGRMINLARAGLNAGADAFYGQPAAWSTLSARSIVNGATPYSAAFENASKEAGMSTGQLNRWFGGSDDRLAQALAKGRTAAGMAEGASEMERQALLRNVLKSEAMPPPASFRAGAGAFGRNLVTGALATGGTIASAAAPALLPMLGIGALVGGGLYGYSQYSNAQKFREMASDDSFSAARDSSAQYGVALKPMFAFTEEVSKATDAISTWSDAVNISGERATLLNEQYQSGSGDRKMVIGQNASNAEILSMVMARGAAQSPQMMAQLLNDVARQRGVDVANRIGAQVQQGRQNLVPALGETMNQITIDAERGWQAPFSSGYSGKKENLEAAGGVADQARTMLEEAYRTGGVAGRGKRQLELLDEFDRQMKDDLKNRNFDTETWVKTLEGVIGDRATEYVKDLQWNAENNPAGLQRDDLTLTKVREIRDSIVNDTKVPVTNTQLQQAQAMSGASGAGSAQFLLAAQRLGLSPTELVDIIQNGPGSEYAEKLGLGPNPTQQDIQRAFGAVGLTSNAQAQGVANAIPQNMTLQYQAVQRGVMASGSAITERQRIMQNLTSGKPMDEATRQSYQAQLSILDQQVVPMEMMQTMTSSQARRMRGTMARQQYAMAIQNPNDAESQARAQEALASMQQVEMEEQQYLQNRAKQAFDFQKSTGRAWEDYYLGVERANEDFQISMARAEEDFQIQRKRTIEEYNISIRRMQEDHDIQLTRMAEDTAKGMLQPFQVLRPQEIWSMSSMSSTLNDQLDFIKDQLNTLDELRKKGLSQQAIDTLDLANPANAQKVAALAGTSKGEIREMNRTSRRANRLGGDVRDEQQSTRRLEEDYQKGLKRGEEDLNRSLRNSEDDFRRSMNRSRQDFTRTMNRQSEDMRRNMSRQLQDFRDMDKEFIGDKQKLMKRINKVIEGGSADWEPVVGNAMKATRRTSQTEWLNMASDSDAAMKWLESSWKKFGLDGTTPSSGPASSFPTAGSNTNTSSKNSASQNTDLRNPKSNKADPANRASSAQSVTYPPTQVSGRGAAMSDMGGKGGDTPVSSAWDGTGNLWGGLRKKWNALFDVIGKYGPLNNIDAGGDAPPGGNAAAKNPTAAAKWLWQALLGDGYSEAQAAGILGNLEQESGFNPRAIEGGNPANQGRGIVQWSKDGRWKGLLAFASSRGMSPWSLSTQYEYMRKEMDSGTFTDGRWSDAAFRNTKTVQDAANYFGANYEIFGIAGSRNSDAEGWYKTFAGKVGASAKANTKGSDKRSIWQIGDAIYQAGQAAEAAAQAGAQGAGYDGPLPGISHGNLDIPDGEWGPPLRGYGAGNPDGGPARDFGVGNGNNPPVYAVFDGTVVSMKLPPFQDNAADGSYGNTLVIRSKQGVWYARYAHLMKGRPYAPGLHVGSKVEAGQHLGWVGTTGNSSSEHLHFEIGKGGIPAENSYNVEPLSVLYKHGVKLAKGGIVTQSQIAMLGEAGDNEAVIPLNRRGIEILADAMSRYATSYEARRARAMAHGTATVTRSAPQVFNSDHSTNFNGPIEVKANDPMHLVNQLDAEARKRNLISTGSRRIR